MGTYRDLVAWQKAMDLVDGVYKVVRQFPDFERYGLSQQMRKAAVSIPSLIAEGRGRYTVPDQRHFYYEARGSTMEIQTEIEIAVRQGFMSEDDGAGLMAQAERVSRMINGLINTLKKPSPPQPLRPQA